MTAQVAIIMGSDSDLPVMQAAADILTELGVSWELDVVSAHRTPDLMVDYARQAESRGIRVVIAGAGGAALLNINHNASGGFHDAINVGDRHGERGFE